MQAEARERAWGVGPKKEDDRIIPLTETVYSA